MSKEWAIYCNLSLWAVQCWPYLWSRWYPPQFFGDTLLTWPSIASLVISSGRGCCCFSLLLVVVLSKLSICFMLLTNWVYGIPVWRVLLNHVHEWNINCILQPCIKKMAAFCSFFGAVRTTRHLENDFFVLWRIINNKFWISSIILVPPLVALCWTESWKRSMLHLWNRFHSDTSPHLHFSSLCISWFASGSHGYQ